MDASHALTDHALGLDWTRIGNGARQAAATFLHDSVAVGIAGSKAPHAKQVLEVATAWGGQGPCAILGGDVRLPAPDAAFVNAFQIHSQEYDCVHEPAVVHPLATIVAVLLAELDRAGPYSGSAVLTALVAGVDVSVALGIAVTTPLRFFRPATAGIFGSIAALARLRGLSRAVTLDALGYGLAFASGTMQAHVEGKPTLPIQIAQAARSAIQAIDLAVAGLPGPHASIEGPFGYLTLFEAGFDIDRLHRGLGAGFRIEEVSWKPFPTGRAAHGAIVATQALMRDQGLTAANLVSLVYRAPSLIHRLVGRPATPVMTPAYARLCFPYLAGAVLERGTVGLDDFSPDKLRDVARLASAAKVTVEADDNPDPAAFTPAVAIARLTDGREIRIGVDHQFGSPAWPLTREQHLEKAQACLLFAGRELLHAPLTALMETAGEAPDLGAALNGVLRRPTH